MRKIYSFFIKNGPHKVIFLRISYFPRNFCEGVFFAVVGLPERGKNPWFEIKSFISDDDDDDDDDDDELFL